MNWPIVDRRLMGEAWIGSRIADHLHVLCDEIGLRWAGTVGEQQAAEYTADQFRICGLVEPRIEPFELKTSDCHLASLRVIGVDSWHADIRPCLFCPSLDIATTLIDVGHGMPHELEDAKDRIGRSVALIQSEFEPFSEPRHLTIRLRDLARLGAVAAVTSSPQKGRRLQHMSAGDWRDGDPNSVPLPLLQTSLEDAQWLKRRVAEGVTVSLRVDSEFRIVTSWNAVADLPGQIDDECIVLGAHHDTTPDSSGANDNATGVAVLLETARLLTDLAQTLKTKPARTIRFVSFGAEEQGLQGSTAFVERHYGPEPRPRLMLALDELATGNMKGVVLQFPELRDIVQQQLDAMNEGLRCHVLSQLDASGDMYPFSRRGIPSSFLWRWRFIGRHTDTAFGHSNSDTIDKVRIRELKEYAGLLARLLLRLADVPADGWPKNQLDVTEIARRIEDERGTVFRTM